MAGPRLWRFTEGPERGKPTGAPCPSHPPLDGVWGQPVAQRRHRCPLSANSGHPTHDANSTRWRYASQSEPEQFVARFVRD
jgi:hypothetical protein